MGQEFYVLRCFSCSTFQTQIVKKVKKWECKMCEKKQSVIKVYGQGTAKDCRLHTQKLNEMRVMKEESELDFVNDEVDDSNVNENSRIRKKAKIEPTYQNIFGNSGCLNKNVESSEQTIDYNGFEYPINNKNVLDSKTCVRTPVNKWSVYLEKTSSYDEKGNNKGTAKNESIHEANTNKFDSINHGQLKSTYNNESCLMMTQNTDKTIVTDSSCFGKESQPENCRITNRSKENSLHYSNEPPIQFEINDRLKNNYVSNYKMLNISEREPTSWRFSTNPTTVTSDKWNKYLEGEESLENNSTDNKNIMKYGVNASKQILAE